MWSGYKVRVKLLMSEQLLVVRVGGVKLWLDFIIIIQLPSNTAVQTCTTPISCHREEQVSKV